jgi:protein-S-isoprenylcysteine O-methyltransferase Ste14
VERVWNIAGKLFFRIRSFAPLPVIYVVMRQSWDSHLSPGLGGPDVDEALNGLGLLLCFLGAGIRFATLGFIPSGTSSQSRTMQVKTLNTEGPYALVRHPLYLGNFFITVGLLCIAHEPWAWGLGLGYWVLSHALIVHSEEVLLRRTYGARFEAWAAEVHAWWPKFSKLAELKGPFAWKRAIQREVNPLVAWGIGATVLLMWERFARNALPSSLGKKYLTVVVALLVLLIANKVWKKVSRA